MGLLHTSLLALPIFVITYFIILAGENSPRKMDRPAAGLLGAVLMVLCGVLSRRQALEAIDFSTLSLLLGMMIIIYYATESGLLSEMARRLVTLSKSPQQLLWTVCWSAGLLSALFVNDTICLLMTPLLLVATRRAQVPLEPYLLALATSSNVGSLMTITGNPQNMLIGQSSHWTWGAFALRMVPIGMVCLVINGLVLNWFYRKSLRDARFVQETNETLEAKPLDRKLAMKTVIVLVGLLIAFLSGAPMDLAALTAAVAILIWANRPASDTFASVDWALLLFFAGLFVVVQGVSKAESVQIARFIPLFTRHPGTLGELAIFSGASVLGSNLFSNVPFVMLLREWVVQAPHAALLWLMLAASSTLAGNLTLVGSVANLIVAQGARYECPLGFWSFFRVGAITTVLTVMTSVFMLWYYGIKHWA